MKPGLVWTVFALCLAAVLVAMGWSSAIVLRLERAEALAQAQAAREENARLALWRMDSALTPLVTRESARPYFHYGAYHASAGGYGSLLAEPAAGQALTASPLLRETPPHVLLHFQLAPDGSITSPQVPEGSLRDRALAHAHLTRAALAERAARLDALRQSVSGATLFASLPADDPVKTAAASKAVASQTPGGPQQQRMKSVKEFEARQQNFESNALGSQLADEAQSPAGAEVQDGAMVPLWSGEELLLARRVRVNGRLYVQGCWLAWPRLRGELLASVRDLLPNARLEPVSGSAGADDERRLAALPARLVESGGYELPVLAGLSPIRLSLLGAWACLLVAAFSVAALLGGLLSLSERRRVFVSAVTHELRTPLTTFRLYADMLAEGMVAGEKRDEYLQRLRGEAERLGHLVENVLFYSRIDSGRAGASRETLELSAALEGVWPRLVERAGRAGLTLVLERSEPLLASVDRSALEQVLFNLVDNACKYAADSRPPLVRVELRRDGARATIHVRDHGPGLTRVERRRLFRPFSKPEREAAVQGPGVGLGLALSRRLMQAQGGDLVLDDSVTPGAAFVASLPIVQKGSG